jgi:hypothetical protein
MRIRIRVRNTACEVLVRTTTVATLHCTVYILLYSTIFYWLFDSRMLAELDCRAIDALIGRLICFGFLCSENNGSNDRPTLSMVTGYPLGSMFRLSKPTLSPSLSLCLSLLCLEGWNVLKKLYYRQYRNVDSDPHWFGSPWSGSRSMEIDQKLQINLISSLSKGLMFYVLLPVPVPT